MSEKNPVVEQIEKFSDHVISFKREAEERDEALSGRIEKLEVLGQRPRGGDYGEFSRDDHEHKDRFIAWMRNRGDGKSSRDLEEAQREIESKSGVAIGTSASGGYAVPAEISRQIEERVSTLNPFRQLCRVDQVGTSSYTALVSKNNAGSGWAAEGGTRSETTTSDLVQCAPTFGELYAYPKATTEAMEDVFFNVEQWLVQEAGDAFAAAEATAIVSGDGSSKPSGFTHTTPVSTGDNSSPERAATALQYFPLSHSSPYALTADDLIDTVMSLKEGYDQGPKVAWVMAKATLGKVRGLKDTTGQFLWQPSLQANVPSTLLGYPVFTSAAMPAASAGNHFIAFGNWARGYLLADRVNNMRIVVDDNITTPGYVKFYIRRRVGGKVLNNEALRLMKYSAS